MRTDAANYSAESADFLTTVKQEFATFESQINAAIAQKKIQQLPQFNQISVDARINIIAGKISDLERAKKNVDIKEASYKASTNPRYKDLMIETSKIRATLQSAITRYSEASSILKSLYFMLEKAKTSITLALQSPSASPSAKTKSGTKKTTIVCVKGKSTLKITGLKPICPSGYRKK